MQDSVVRRIEIRTKGKTGFLSLDRFVRSLDTLLLQTEIDGNCILTGTTSHASKRIDLLFFSDKARKKAYFRLELCNPI